VPAETAEGVIEETTPAIEPKAVAPIVLDASEGALLTPETNGKPGLPVIEEKGSVPQADLPTIDDLLPENK
jgi:hypothetical protein